jgi:glutathione S-transferase
MSQQPPPAAEPIQLIGRSSSVFTRVARMFASEFGVPYGFRIVPSLLSTDPADYGQNPLLRLPVLESPAGTWFGSLNICRELARRSTSGRRCIWPEGLELPLLANAQELTLVGMSTEVTLIMNQLGGVPGDTAHVAKLRTSLTGALGWLDARVPALFDALPAERDVSFLEVSLFCFVTHLAFRQVLPLDAFARLVGFCEEYGERRSAQGTPYRFDG